MSKMKDLSWDIEQLWIDGHSVAEISDQLNCSEQLVLDWLTEQNLVEPEDDFDDYEAML